MRIRLNEADVPEASTRIGLGVLEPTAADGRVWKMSKSFFISADERFSRPSKMIKWVVFGLGLEISIKL